MKRAKPTIIILTKLLVSVGLLGYFLSRVHPERFVHTFASANYSWIALALIVYLCTQAISAVRWAVLARPLGIETPFKDLLKFYLIGMFFNLFAPGTVGGDVSRVFYLVRDEEAHAEGRAVSTTHAAMSVLMDRAIGMIVLVWLGAAGLLLFPEYAIPATVRSVTLLIAAGFVAAALLIPMLRRVLPEDGHPMVVKIRLALRSYRTQWRALAAAVLISLVVHLIQAWMHVVMGRALGLELPFSFCMIVYPLVGTFAAIPVSLNGLGLREGGYLYLLAVIGIGTEKGVAFGLLLFLIVALDSLIGGFLFLLQKPAKPTAVIAEKAI
ncbi:MAG TPA: lysylphosphatidylglycerol synthase transmembrane domain-containing protein [Acidobacteriota bacterium]|nr:lysylphosphatidylglycerol synthase transmembrane domain-containing protein [Acidobacteriota bacterium]